MNAPFDDYKAIYRSAVNEIQEELQEIAAEFLAASSRLRMRISRGSAAHDRLD
jgi:hypothetical protein